MRRMQWKMMEGRREERGEEKKREMKTNKQTDPEPRRRGGGGGGGGGNQSRRERPGRQQQKGGEGRSSVGTDWAGGLGRKVCVCLGGGGQCITALAFSPSGRHSTVSRRVLSSWAMFFISSPVACFWFSFWTPIYEGHSQWRISSQLAVNSPVLWRRLIDFPSPNSCCYNGGGRRQVKNHPSPASKSPLQQIPEGWGMERVRAKCILVSAESKIPLQVLCPGRHSP